MPPATATPVFPISEQYDGFDFNPEMHYAQVLVEARKHGRSEILKWPWSINGSNPIVVGDISSSKHVGVEISMGDMKRRRLWKNAFFFWRKLLNHRKRNREQYDLNMEVQAIPQRSGFKSRSGRIYLNDFHVDQSRRSNGAQSRRRNI